LSIIARYAIIARLSILAKSLPRTSAMFAAAEKSVAAA